MAELKEIIEAARRSPQGEPMTVEALEYRAALADAQRRDEANAPDIDAHGREEVLSWSETSAETLARDAISDRAEAIERNQGARVARAFYEVASGAVTPLSAYVDRWLSEGSVKGGALRERTKLERRRAVEKLGASLTQQKLARESRPSHAALRVARCRKC